MDWPLDYLKTVKEIKVFGIFLMDSYRSMVKRNWDYRFEKFQEVVNSWSPRILETLTQRVEVLRMFALSRVYYVASILPVRITMVRKFEKTMGKFIWTASGKLLRVPIDELKNETVKGGLNVPCVLSMCNSLLLSQLAGLVVEGRVSELITVVGWKSLTNKLVYAEYAKAFTVTKVEREAVFPYKDVWRRVNLPVLTAVARDSLFLLVHNKYPVKERLFRIGLAVDPYCEVCPGGIICDVEHFFCSCSTVTLVWRWVRGRVVEMLGAGGAQVSNWEMINLVLPTSTFDKEIVWLVGTYVTRVWEEISVRGGALVKAEQFFGFLRFKYRLAQLGSRTPLDLIPGFFG